MIDQERTIRIEVRAHRWWWWLFTRPTIVVNGIRRGLHFGVQNLPVGWGLHRVELLIEWRLIGGVIYRFDDGGVEVSRDNPKAVIYERGRPVVIIVKSGFSYDPSEPTN